MHSFDSLLGNSSIKQSLQTICKKKQVPTSLLFSGKQGVGKALFAKAFAALLLETEDLSQHPDFFLFQPEGKSGMHSIDSLRFLGKEAMQLPYVAKKKVFLVKEAERMQKTSSNALLKTFEEPAKTSCIILVTSQKESLLPTLLSRCYTFSFSPLKEEEIYQFLKEKKSLDEKTAKNVAKMSEGSLKKALQLADLENKVWIEALFTCLSQGNKASFFEISNLTQQLNAVCEKKKTTYEKTHPLIKTDKTVFQIAEMEKLREGDLKQLTYLFLKDLLDLILFWFRDLHLIQVGGAVEDLILSQTMDQKCQNPCISLEKLEDIAFDTLLSFERGAAFTSLLENLFLQILR